MTDNAQQQIDVTPELCDLVDSLCMDEAAGELEGGSMLGGPVLTACGHYCVLLRTSRCCVVASRNALPAGAGG